MANETDAGAGAKPEQLTCIGCGDQAVFTVTLLGYRLRVSPAVKVNTSRVGVCYGCANPKNESKFEHLGRTMAVLCFGLCNDLDSKVRELAGQVADGKNAAAGA